ncbi:hypothetical protein ACTXT7_013529 [Hymenolepis weldensis]
MDIKKRNIGAIRRKSAESFNSLNVVSSTYEGRSSNGRQYATLVFVGDHTPPPASMLPELMEELIDWINSEEALALHPIELAALIHWKLVYIHPFYDGNGRTARLVMNLILMRAGYPPAIVRKEDRATYYEGLKSANSGDVRPFIRFIADCAETAIDEYLRASEKTIIVDGTTRPTVIQVGSLMPYTAPPLHFPWLPKSWKKLIMSALRAAIELLRREMRNARVKVEVDFHSMIMGSSSAFVDLYRYLFCNFDRNISLHLASNNFLLTGTTDRRFTETLYRICRDLLKVKPPLSLAQFFTNSFVEKKLRMSAEIVKSVAELKSRLNRRALSASRIPQKTPRILTSTRSWMGRRQTALSSKSLNSVARIPVQQKVTSSLTNPITPSKLILALQDDKSIQEPEYMSDLMTSLNTISNRISQIFDRVAGIEVRVSAIEKPLRDTNANKHPSTVSEEGKTKSNPEEDIERRRKVTATQTDLPPKYPNGVEQNPLLVRSDPVQVTEHLIKRTQQPVDAPPSLLDVNSSVETTDCASQLLFKSVDRYSPEVITLSSGDGLKMPRNPSICTRPTFTASSSSDRLHKLLNEDIPSYRSKSCYDEDASCRKNVDLDSHGTRPVSMDYRLKVFGSDDNLGLDRNHYSPYLNNRNDYSVYRNNSNDTRFDVDQSLEQQVSRISNMLAETQILLNSRRPIPHS